MLLCARDDVINTELLSSQQEEHEGETKGRKRKAEQENSQAGTAAEQEETGEAVEATETIGSGQSDD